MFQLGANVTYPGESTEKITTQFPFLSLLLFKFKFTFFIKNMAVVMRNAKENNDLV